MRYKTIIIGILFCLLFQQDISAETLYTWIAPEGTIHISKQKPPENNPLTDQMGYTARISPQPKTQAKTSVYTDTGDAAVLAATRQAKQARKQAQEARHSAEKAIETANQIKKETEAFLKPWRNKKRIRKPMQVQIENRIQQVNQVIADAERLIASANLAEKRAQSAEKKARRIQDQFFEAYRLIVSK